MYNSALPCQNQQDSKTGSDGGTLNGSSTGRGLLASYHGYDSQAHSSDTDIHAFLASELFGPSLNTGGAEESANTELSQENLSWERTPGAPESYQTEALKLFGDQVAAEHDDIASASRFLGHSSGAVAQISLDPDPSQISSGHQRRKDKRKSGSGHKEKKRSTPLHQVFPLKSCLLGAETKRCLCQDRLALIQGSPDTIYDQLEKANRELRELKVQHQQLESKNLLLEKCLKLEHNHKLRQTSSEVLSC